MHRATRQQILKEKLGDGIDVGVEPRCPWKPGYKNNINGGTRGTKVASRSVLEAIVSATAQRGAISESVHAPIGYGGALRLFSP